MNHEKRFKEAYEATYPKPSDRSEDFFARTGIVRHKANKVKKYRNPIRRAAIFVPLGALSVVVLTPFAFFFIMSIQSKPNFRIDKVSYVLHTQKEKNQETFRSLNNIEYPNRAYSYKAVSEEYRDKVNAFSLELARGVNLRENTVFSPLAAYLALDNASYAGDEATRALYDEAMGGENIRNAGYTATMQTDFFLEESMSNQIYHGQFFNVEHPLGVLPEQEYIDHLTSRSVEAYEASFSKDLGKIASWVNGKLGEEFARAEDFAFTDDSMMAQITLNYFKGKWLRTFYKENTSKRVFHGEEDYYVPMMTHTYSEYVARNINEVTRGHGAYEYDKYFSVYDNYLHDYSIQYLIPKKESDNIFDLLEGVDYLTEKKENYFFLAKEGDGELRPGTYHKNIELSVPKFSLRKKVDLKDSLAQAGLGKLFDRSASNHALGHLLQGKDEYGSWLEKIEQTSNIEFNENGTIAKSLTFVAFGAAGAAAPAETGLIVELNQPFVYVIRDPNDLPLYIGSVVNPLG